MTRKLWISITALLVIAILVGGAIYHFTGSEGTLVVQLSDPKADVKIEVDGKPMMPGEDGIYRLAVGDYEVSVKGDDYESDSKLVRIKARERKVVAFELRQKPKPPPVVVKVDPEELKRRQAEAAKVLDEAAKLLDDPKSPDVLPLIRKAAELDPTSARAIALRGRAHARRDQYSYKDLVEAKKDLALASKLDPEIPEVLLLESIIRYRSIDFEGSLKKALMAIEKDSKLALAHALAGRIHLLNDNLAEGLSHCNFAIKLNPELISAWQYRALAHGCLGQWDKALADVDMVMKLNDSDSYAYLVKGEILARLDKLDQGRELIRAKKIAPGTWEGLLFPPPIPKYAGPTSDAIYKALNLTKKAREAFDQKSSLDKAMDWLEAALKLDPECATAIALRGAIFLFQEETAKARADCDYAITLDPTQSRAYSTRLILYGDQEADKMIADATVVISLGDGSIWRDGSISHAEQSQALVRRAVGFSRLHEYQQAIHDCQAALKLNGNEASPHRHLGYAYALSGDFKKALLHYDSYLKLQPKDDPRAYLYRAGVHMKMNDRIKALADLKKAAVLDDDLANEGSFVFPDPPKEKLTLKAEDYAQRAKMHEKHGKLERAIADWTIALSQNPAFHWNRALAYEARGDFLMAKIDVETAIKQNPKRAEFYEKLAHLKIRLANSMHDLLMARVELDRGIALDDPEKARFLWQRSALRQRLGKLVYAAEDREAAIKLDPSLAKQKLPSLPEPKVRAFVLSGRFTGWGGRERD